VNWIRVRHARVVALGIVVALASAVAIVAIAPASGATQFKHSATSPTFQLGTQQGVAYSVTNEGTAAVTCHAEFRRSDGTSFNKIQPSLDPGKASVQIVLGAPQGQTTLRFVVTSTSSTKPNPCLPLVEIVTISGGGYNVDGIVSNFVVTNSAV
jgi:hypothetical protein